MSLHSGRIMDELMKQQQTSPCFIMLCTLVKINTVSDSLPFNTDFEDFQTAKDGGERV